MFRSSQSAALRQTPAGVVCVDLDGTLVAGDLLWESFVELVRRQPLRALMALAGLWRGKACFKREIAAQVRIDPRTLPYRAEVLSALEESHRAGASLVLATASDETHARAVAAHLGIFADVLASDGRTNLSGRQKAAALVDRYGAGEFHYFGNDWADVPVWRVAAEGTAVAASPAVVRRARGTRAIREIGVRHSKIASLVRAMRPHQWVKNLLVFVPLVAAHTVTDIDRWTAAVLTFVVFSLCASGIYIINDILDISSDRRHPRKRTRPFAAGELGIPFGLAASAALISVGIAVAVAGVSIELAAIAIAYLGATSLYSVVLKRKPVADVFTLTGLYVLRIVAGGVATATPLSSWFLAFSLFIFLSLAWLKRFTEVAATEGWLAGRGYRHEDAAWMQSIGTSAGYMAIVVLALYLSAPEVTVLYSRPQILWLLCPLLLFWLTRMWLRAGRGLVHDDPVVEALKDPWSYVAAATAGMAVVLAAA
jgi:4-hydroxybenzoate polyprenyltransferase